MSALYWRAEENGEEDAINPFSRAADRADQKLEGNIRRAIRRRAEDSFRNIAQDDSP